MASNSINSSVNLWRILVELTITCKFARTSGSDDEKRLNIPFASSRGKFTPGLIPNIPEMLGKIISISFAQRISKKQINTYFTF